jgi:hypothetical protein
MKKLTLTLICFIAFSFVAKGQTNFDIGFKEGFKNGYCYSNNQSGYYCNPPLPPLPPLPQISESSNSYQDGYNRGFLYGQSQRRNDDNNSSSNVSSNPPKFNPYVSQIPVDTMISVGMIKQQKYDTRTNWVQERIYKLSDLITSLFTQQRLPGIAIESTRNIYIIKIRDYVGSIYGADYTNDYQFNNIVDGFQSVENEIYRGYNSCVESENKRNIARQEKELSVGKIGVRWETTVYYPQITEIIYGGAAWKSNQFEVGDKIVSVAQGENTLFTTYGKTLNYVYGLITGTKGTMVRLKIMKKDNSYKIISLIRE